MKYLRYINTRFGRFVEFTIRINHDSKKGNMLFFISFDDPQSYEFIQRKVDTFQDENGNNIVKSVFATNNTYSLSRYR
jgi:hypothetical protein